MSDNLLMQRLKAVIASKDAATVAGPACQPGLMSSTSWSWTTTGQTSCKTCHHPPLALHHLWQPCTLLLWVSQEVVLSLGETEGLIP